MIKALDKGWVDLVAWRIVMCDGDRRRGNNATMKDANTASVSEHDEREEDDEIFMMMIMMMVMVVVVMLMMMKKKNIC
jgi:heme/copper-type cytochrome/quinol oxidase subunit 2